MDKYLKFRFLVAVFMSMCIVALWAVAFSSELSFSLKVFTAFASGYGFYELYIWVKNKKAV